MKKGIVIGFLLLFVSVSLAQAGTVSLYEKAGSKIHKKITIKKMLKAERKAERKALKYKDKRFKRGEKIIE